MPQFTVRQIAVGGFDHNFSYLVRAWNGDAAIVDPCGDAEKIRAVLAELPPCRPRYLLVTHAHPDHISALNEVRGFFPAPLAAMSAVLHPDIPVHDAQDLPFGDSVIHAIATPGHAADSICWKLGDNSAVFTGDTLFIGCIGFCRPRPMFESLKKLKRLPDSMLVYAGHDYGDSPFDTLGEQKRKNEYLAACDYETFRAALNHLT